MKKLKLEKHERMHGPHFNEECAMYAVDKMHNEDGTHGQHWSLEECMALANQHGIDVKSDKFNKYDWYVALNMIYSDFYKVIMTLAGANRTKYFVEFAKAWLCDKDVEEGKMWYYFKFVMCDDYHEEDEEEYDEYDYDYPEAHHAMRSRGRMSGRHAHDNYYAHEDDEYGDRKYTEPYYHSHGRSSRYTSRYY